MVNIVVVMKDRYEFPHSRIMEASCLKPMIWHGSRSMSVYVRLLILHNHMVILATDLIRIKV